MDEILESINNGDQSRLSSLLEKLDEQVQMELEKLEFDSVESSPLHLAVANKRNDLALILIENGGKIMIKKVHVLLQ